MNNEDKRKELQRLKESGSESDYYDTLEKMGDMKYNYGDYLITEPIDCDMELTRLEDVSVFSSRVTYPYSSTLAI